MSNFAASPQADHGVIQQAPVTADVAVGKRASNAEKPYDLPPCKVCGDKGTGFHYGVNTCEACKVREEWYETGQSPTACTWWNDTELAGMAQHGSNIEPT